MGLYRRTVARLLSVFNRRGAIERALCIPSLLTIDLNIFKQNSCVAELSLILLHLETRKSKIRIELENRKGEVEIQLTITTPLPRSFFSCGVKCEQ